VAADTETGLTRKHVPLRVLHLRDSPWIDGPGRTILETASSIDRTRIDYQVAALVDSRGMNHPLVDAMRRRSLPVHAVVDDGTSLHAVVQQVTALIDAHGIDILHTSEFRSSLVGLICRRRHPVLHVRTAHGWIANDLRGRLKALIDRALLRSCDQVILVSHALRRQLPRWWVPDCRLRVLHNALDLERYENVPRRTTQLAIRSGTEIVLLNVGRLSPEKGQALLLKALAKLAPHHPGLCVAIAGVGPLESGLRAMADALGIGERVKFLGYIADMPSIYGSAALVVQCSLTEGLPNVILEAACLEVPIVATDVGGTPEVIEHGVSGWLIRPNSLEDLIAGIEHFLENPVRFSGMAQAARVRIQEHFSIQARTAAQSCLYEEMCSAKR
jgi:glycosyltransferase involved in cell wall biosynthesis